MDSHNLYILRRYGQAAQWIISFTNVRAEVEMAAMRLMGTIEECRLKVKHDVNRLLKTVQRHSSSTISTVEEGVIFLAALRKEVYEDLNQIQHEYASIRALEWLTSHDASNASLIWYWNPRAMGSANEPDLRGQLGLEVQVSVEVTTSSAPIGVIDQRMAKTLAKLSQMNGKQYYFVISSSMATRARTKVAKAGYGVTVIDLSEDHGVPITFTQLAQEGFIEESARSL